jgi:hypothetical protein
LAASRPGEGLEGSSKRIEEQRASPEAKVDEQPRIGKRVIDEARLNEPSHGSSWSLKARVRPGHTLYSDGTGAVCPTLARMDMKLAQLFEKFMVAVDMLATSPASIQKRLEEAYRSFIDVESEDSMTRRCKSHLNKFALG